MPSAWKAAVPKVPVMFVPGGTNCTVMSAGSPMPRNAPMQKTIHCSKFRYFHHSFQLRMFSGVGRNTLPSCDSFTCLPPMSAGM